MGFVSAAMGLVSLFGAKKQASEAKQAARGQAALDTRITQEKVFQLEQQERRLAGETRAMAVGSGVKAGVGSPMDILNEQAATFAREKLFTQQVGAERAQQAMQRGKSIADQAMFSGVTSAIGHFGQAAASTAANKSFFGFKP